MTYTTGCVQVSLNIAHEIHVEQCKIQQIRFEGSLRVLIGKRKDVAIY